MVPVTIHMPLKDVFGALSTERILKTLQITARDVARYFGVARPRIAVTGLNPHAGEDGTMGREEIEMIVPAIAAAQRQGLDVTGPYPADTLFHAEARKSYDVAVAMYHDQALIPVKTLAFDTGVNVTLGLPFVRTSPDHGTAFALAGTGKGKPEQPDRGLARCRHDAAERGRSALSTQDGLPPLRDIIRDLGLTARKSLGQNFLLDFNLTRRIARAAGPLEGATIVEVGPGAGRPDPSAAHGGCVPRHRHREGRALPARACAISPRPILGGSRLSPATRARSTMAPSMCSALPASSPTFPIASPRRS